MAIYYRGDETGQKAAVIDMMKQGVISKDHLLYALLRDYNDEQMDDLYNEIMIVFKNADNDSNAVDTSKPINVELRDAMTKTYMGSDYVAPNQQFDAQCQFIDNAAAITEMQCAIATRVERLQKIAGELKSIVHDKMEDLHMANVNASYHY